jgi:hypothetical protein
LSRVLALFANPLDLELVIESGAFESDDVTALMG